MAARSLSKKMVINLDNARDRIGFLCKFIGPGLVQHSWLRVQPGAYELPEVRHRPLGGSYTPGTFNSIISLTIARVGGLKVKSNTAVQPPVSSNAMDTSVSPPVHVETPSIARSMPSTCSPAHQPLPYVVLRVLGTSGNS